MSLTFYGHPLSAYCHKVLIALYETDTPFDFRLIDLGLDSDRELIGALTPLGKMPALTDDAAGVTIAESSLIIEYLARHHPGAVALLPADPDAAMEARVWDRIFDIHVMNVFQAIVDAKLFMGEGTDERVTPFVLSQMDRAYAAINRHLDGREWAAGDFGLADCAAAPALFYGGILHPFDDHPHLGAYFERLIARPSVARVLEEAKPSFGMFPFVDKMPARFR